MNKFMCLKHGKVGYDKCRECRKEEQTNNWEEEIKHHRSGWIYCEECKKLKEQQK